MSTSHTDVLELQGAGAIITGGGSGINLAFAQALERLFDVYAERFGGVPDVVVAGAGIYEASSAGFWDDRDNASHYTVIDVNLVHPIKLTRIALRLFRQAQQPGVIMHESSIVALRPSAVLPLYAATKAGLSHFVRCMAPLHELSGIKVVAVAPGLVDTPLFRQHPDAQEHVDMSEDFFLPPDEVVKAMLALLTQAQYRGGTVLEINDIGGWRKVQLHHDPGPQGKSKIPRRKGAEMMLQVEKALQEDGKGVQGSCPGTKL
ncbi:hypothetical protein E8E13_000853 [Curvularia kusanoi]|uniref:Uncharacterized protein n=1 Tax=Curvularia kusanoi TaxID=90978 RepID=A0A9P4TEE5_CURKU|nr:hypothetical protein E8E13_000853 [Curvularia kusanoi]